MTTIQMALREALPEMIAEFRRREAHEKAVARGRRLMLEATRHSINHKSVAAILAVRQNREACACYLAQQLGRPVMAPRGKPSGFSELGLMEEFWRQKARETWYDPSMHQTEHDPDGNVL